MDEPQILHSQISAALSEIEFKRDAAGKSGESLRLAVRDALSKSRIAVKVVSVGLAKPETHSSSPYQAVWERHPGAAAEVTHFDV